MRLFVAEKPQIAQAICEGLGGGFTNQDGCYMKGDDAVINCFGHMLALKDPEEYDPAYEKWELDLLPFCFLPAEKKPSGDDSSKKRLMRIIELIKQADVIVNAGDEDDEGQLLVDEILRYAGNTKPVYRFLSSSLTPKAVVKALSEMKPNEEYEAGGYRAEARSIADQVFGYNFTRLFTVLSREVGGHGVISVGRVQTPILGLVVRRDRANTGHQKSYFYTLAGEFNFEGLPAFKAKYMIKEDDPVDENNRIVDKDFAQSIASSCKQQKASVISIDTKQKKKSPPLPHNLLSLQQEAARKWGYDLDETQSVTQSLREKHKVITYNRTDCRYLTSEHFEEAPTVLNAIFQTTKITASVDMTIKGKAFNDSKITAHHAIIPTETVADLANFTEQEKNIYLLIANAYIVQFYPDYTYLETTILIDVAGNVFGGKTKVDVDLGWKLFYANDNDDEETKEDEDVMALDLRSLSKGQAGNCLDCKVEDKETKPPALFTKYTLAGALSRVANEVKDPNLAKVLKEKDKDKPDESGGIGTPATRAEMVKKLFERNFLVEKNGKVVSTDLGKAFYDQLPDLLKYPDMTAIWYDQQKNIQTNEDAEAFVNKMMEQVVTPLTARLKKVKLQGIESHDCPKCGRFMRRMKDEKGVFWWGCSGYSDEENPCKNSMDDVGGKPVPRQPKPKKKSGKGFGLRL